MSVKISKNNYRTQAELLLSILPVVMEEKIFALKGGTAINLFVRNMPRLSIDIDLTHIPIEERLKSLSSIETALIQIKNRLQRLNPLLNVQEKRLKVSNRLAKLFIKRDNAEIKIEPNEVLRGTVYPCENYNLSKIAEELFKISILDIPTLSFADLYAGKICAALDRQHPRDFFDIKLLFENEGITDNIRKAFVVYLASGSRPMYELLNPNLIDISNTFFKEFEGMTNVPVTLDELLETRKLLIKTIQKTLTENERLFLLSIKQGEPAWDLIDLPHIQQLPAIQWKLQNIQKMDKNKHAQIIKQLKNVLSL